MSRGGRLHRLIGMALTCLAASALPGRAQEPPSGPERNRLEAELAAIEARLDRFDRVEREREARIRAELETREISRIEARVGPFRIDGPRADVEAALPVAREFWDASEDLLGEEPHLPDLRIQLTRSADVSSIVEGQPTLRRLPYTAGVTHETSLQMTMQQLLAIGLPSRLHSWSGGRGWDTRSQPGVAYRALLQNPHHTATRCSQQADIQACMDHLFVAYDDTPDVSAEMLDRWYPTDGTLTGAFEGSVAPARRASMYCRAEPGDPKLADRRRCLLDLAETPLLFNVIPSKPIVRGSLLRFALQRNGPADLSVLESLPENASIAEQLEVLSGISIEQLVAEWREAMTLNTFAASEGDRGRSPLSLLWTGALVMLGLRSTRWRLG